MSDARALWRVCMASMDTIEPPRRDWIESNPRRRRRTVWHLRVNIPPMRNTRVRLPPIRIITMALDDGQASTSRDAMVRAFDDQLRARVQAGADLLSRFEPLEDTHGVEVCACPVVAYAACVQT